MTRRLHALVILGFTTLGLVRPSGAQAPSGTPAALQPYDSEPSTTRPADPAQVVTQSTWPEGFHASVFASEPDITQPISITTDPRGRLWVGENNTYSESAIGYHTQLRDRILILEDTDHDGRQDRRTVFWDRAERLTSVEVGLGGVWAICLPNLVFIPDANGDDVPDGPPQVLLDGFEFQNARHTVANGLRWGPDGWLYGRQGILGTSVIGAPGTPEKERTRLNVGIWRYHPTRRVFEVVAEGTTNPWGMDWDARGEPFFINTVIGHLWHVIPGAHYRRMFGDDPSPDVYEPIEQHAEHVHWATGEVWTDVRKGVTDATLAAGGGHAHTGLLIYQGGQWPAAWQGKLLTINLHGRRLNIERLDSQGSGFVGRREPDAFLFADPWFRGIDLIAAPDGGVLVSDWSDTGECHDHDGIHRASGRVYHLAYGARLASATPALPSLSSLQLARLQTHTNDWITRQARRLLADRARSGQDLSEAVLDLKRTALSAPDEIHRLRALWALHAMQRSDPSLLEKKLQGTPSERSWALRLLEDHRHLAPETQPRFEVIVRTILPGMAATEPAASVRLTLASLLQRLPANDRVPLAAALLAHSEDVNDHNLPLMLWYGIRALAPSHPALIALVTEARIPKVQRLAARRLAEASGDLPAPLDALLLATSKLPESPGVLALLDGISDGFLGRRKVPKPASWNQVQSRFAHSTNAELRDRVIDLGGLFGDGRALEAIREVAINDAADPKRRRAALQSLIDARAPELREACEKALPVRDLSATAASGLALFDDPILARKLVAEWPRLYGHERPAVINALLSRPAWAGILLDEIADGRFRRADLGVFQARQIRAFQNADLTRRLTEVWGTLHDPDDATRASRLQSWKSRLNPEALAKADLHQGKALFAAACASCHQLYGEGGRIGPDLTGSGRDNIEYLLDNLLFPSAVVPADYRQVTVSTKDGRTLSGIVRTRAPQTVTLQTVGELVTLDRTDISEELTSNLSLMPEGLLEALAPGQAEALFAYLMRRTPLPAPESR